MIRLSVSSNVFGYQLIVNTCLGYTFLNLVFSTFQVCLLVLSVGVMNGNTLIIESAQKLEVILQHEVKEMFEHVTTSSDFESGAQGATFYTILSQSLSKFPSARIRLLKYV